MQFIEFDGNKFKIHYKKSVQYMTDEESIELRNRFSYDVCFKNNEAYHFCYKIDDVLVIEETKVKQLETV